MWLLSKLPETVFHICIIIGVVGLIATYLVKLIPFIYRYVLPIQILSVALLIFGVYYSGVAANEAKWQQEARELESKVQVAEEKARTASAKIEYVFVDRVQKVKDVQIIVQEKLRDISVSIDSTCKVSPEAVKLLNAAAKNVKPGDSK